VTSRWGDRGHDRWAKLSRATHSDNEQTPSPPSTQWIIPNTHQQCRILDAMHCRAVQLKQFSL